LAKLILVFIFILFYNQLYAEDFDAGDFDFNNLASDEDSFSDDDDKKITSTKIQTQDVFKIIADTDVTAAAKFKQDTLDAPAIISVIPARRFLDYGHISINDAIYTMPGFFPSQDYDRRTIGSRGMFEGWNNNHFMLLIDGIPMNDNLYGTAYTSEITPVSIIRTMEVIRGPGSALYGSNATNGVIMLNTLSGANLNGAVETRARYGSQQRFVYDVMTGNTGQIFDYFIAYNYFTTDGVEYNSYDDFNESRRIRNGKPFKAQIKDSRQSNAETAFN